MSNFVTECQGSYFFDSYSLKSEMKSIVDQYAEMHNYLKLKTPE